MVQARSIKVTPADHDHGHLNYYSSLVILHHLTFVGCLLFATVFSFSVPSADCSAILKEVGSSVGVSLAYQFTKVSSSIQYPFSLSVKNINTNFLL